MQAVERLVTHSGKFHADDVLAFAVLAIVFPQAALVRTRDPAVVGAAVPSVVFDVGGVFDPAAMRFDHHMRGGPARPCGQPYSTFGLVWQAFGMEALRINGVPRRVREAVWADLDAGLVTSVDRIDTGRWLPGEGEIAHILEDYNPHWDEDGGDGAWDARFRQAAEVASSVLWRRAASVEAVHSARAAVEDAAARSADPRIVELERGMPWRGVLATDAHPLALFVLHPSHDGSEWMVEAVPPEPGSFEQRLPLPESWAGLRDAALEAETGIPGAVFCHASRFICGARDRAGALAMAQAALGAEHRPEGPAAR